MKNRPVLTTSRAVRIFEEMIDCRRDYCADNQFFRMSDVWAYLCDEDGRWSINTFRSEETEDFKRRAGVIAFGDRVTLTADERLMENAAQGCKLSNFILAHELGHVALGHHAKSATTKNFQLFAGPNGMSNLPPTLEELEANYAAVFFQCGVALLDIRWDPIRLAHRAFSDVNYVRKAQSIVRLEVFQRELRLHKPTYPRVVL
ncbi:MAG: hypothetical protein DI533_03450 [Cereibacter sphaeroides]|uniref:IrrE N-terminal-like domain-containing protein n=1 Tax=Cereibacter sphaeroides TaxID=1063 RepID=A0A2W5SCE2_CERSP|nr:MAG: hypothetical protein DI533_03450 [Cereibacter sphaeroides]